jgi:hypothetical protein
MAEDWRVKVAFTEEEHGNRLSRFLRERELEKELANRLRGRVVVSQDGPKLFLYGETRDQAEAALQVVNDFLAEHGVHADIGLARWHELEEEWVDPSVPVPRTPDAQEAARRRLTAEERQESEQAGMDEWEVQVVLPDHKSTRQLAERLEREGLRPLRRWRYLVVPVPSEEDGNALAERIRSEAPPEARIAVEGSYGEVVAANPRLSAFSLFGGLGA